MQPPRGDYFDRWWIARTVEAYHSRPPWAVSDHTIMRVMDDALVTPNAEFVGNLRHSIRRAQRQLIENPDPTSPWWFLVDPDAPEVDDGVTNPWA